MKTSLPTLVHSSQFTVHRNNTPESRGFTLVELLVAITIIAVLAAVGVVVFGGVQAKARDSRRSQDLTAIANALEGKRVAGTIYYTALTSGDFAGGAIPTDPRSSTQQYCLWGSTDVPPVPPIAKPTSASVTWTSCAGPSADYTAVVGTGVPVDATKVTSWTVCAKQESVTDGVECVFSKL